VVLGALHSQPSLSVDGEGGLRTGPLVGAPDVTVVTAVYNTMPYLTECLQSLVDQSIGLSRMEIIAIDDGSDDGSGDELDKWAKRYPGTLTVLHQPNSGGPAAPSNRALAMATGRYVFFLGADDRLGVEALERLVTAADDLDADIVLGRLVGAAGRYVNQAVYADGNRDDINLTDSALPWALSNTKLFRRSMVEEHGIRFPEELRSGSDQPFTLRAIAVARRIAVRADYKFYYAVRRVDSSNITYRTSLTGFVHDATAIMETVTNVVVDPVARERVLLRHFSWELGKLLGERFLAADRDQQKNVHEGVRALADRYMSEAIRVSLEARHRIPLSVAQYGTLDDLLAVIKHYVASGLSPAVIDGDRVFAALPGFREPLRGFSDSWFDFSDDLPRLVRTARVTGVEWGLDEDGRTSLVVRLRVALPHLDTVAGGTARVIVGDQPAPLTVEEEGPTGTVVRAELPLALLRGGGGGPEVLPVHFSCSVLGQAHTVAVTGSPPSGLTRILCRRGLRFSTVVAGYDGKRHLVVRINPVGPRRVARRLLAGLHRR
jgi:glycosyltransferase involved in cell wall biosynthesis